MHTAMEENCSVDLKLLTSFWKDYNELEFWSVHQRYVNLSFIYFSINDVLNGILITRTIEIRRISA